MKKFLLPLVGLVLLLGGGCARRTDDQAAVRQAIERYLASRPNLNMSGMELQIGGVRIREDSADADVTFRSKTDKMAALSMHYKLRRRGGNWEVEPPSGGHSGAGGDLPSAHPPAGTTPPAPELPPSHPPVKPK